MDADVIVWAPNDFQLPPSEAQEWLDNWLRESYGEKVLVYIGRDYDDAVRYWTFVRDNTPPERLPQVHRRLADAVADTRTARNKIPTSAEWPEWFTIDGTTNRQQVRSLAGPWATGVDARRVEIERHSHIVPHADAEVLLSTGDGDPLVSEIVFEWDGTTWTSEDWQARDELPPDEVADSRLIIVENGSFLLNRPLVNHEHRKLAGQLIAHVGPPRKHVVFLQSFPGGPPVRDTDPTGRPPSGLAMFTVWPLSGVLVHVAALGIVFALARWPIFGVPQRPRRQSLTDFGAHVEAVGKLLEKMGDSSHALSLLRSYRQAVLGDGHIDGEATKS
jgi:hypothetical protein